MQSFLTPNSQYIPMLVKSDMLNSSTGRTSESRCNHFDLSQSIYSYACKIWYVEIVNWPNKRLSRCNTFNLLQSIYSYAFKIWYIAFVDRTNKKLSQWNPFNPLQSVYSYASKICYAVLVLLWIEKKEVYWINKHLLCKSFLSLF